MLAAASRCCLGVGGAGFLTRRAASLEPCAALLSRSPCAGDFRCSRMAFGWSSTLIPHLQSTFMMSCQKKKTIIWSMFHMLRTPCALLPDPGIEPGTQYLQGQSPTTKVLTTSDNIQLRGGIDISLWIYSPMWICRLNYPSAQDSNPGPLRRRCDIVPLGY